VEQSEIKWRFYQVLAFLEEQGGTGKDTRLRSDCGQKARSLARAYQASVSAFCSWPLTALQFAVTNRSN
jgi:hypothetical protein